MRIGLFTDTYFPQVSGVATSVIQYLFLPQQMRVSIATRIGILYVSQVFHFSHLKTGE